MEFWDLHPSKQTAPDMLEKIVTFKRVVETQGLPPSPPIAAPPVPAKV
jgi:hypothetical protein